MRKLIIANWKMNPVSKNQAQEIFNGIKKGVDGVAVEVVVCPPFVYLPLLNGLALGAQNCFWEEKGAFTGEVSAKMLKDLGAEYVIIGHSERRKYFGETNEIINKKIKSAIEVELEQIFCVGETDQEREAGKQEEVVERQIKDGLKDVSDILGMVIAYEPVWAIGTGKACGAKEAQEMKTFIEKVISGIYGKDVLKEVRILYGGSVKSQNAAGYIKEAGYDGLLVGGASLDPEEFTKIIRSAE